MAFSLACDAGKTTLRIEGTDSNVTWSEVANAGAGSVAVDGGGTEDPSFFVTEHVANAVYQILKKVQFGDGSNTLIFYSKNETVHFDNGQFPTIKNNATLQLGGIVGDYCVDGACWSWDDVLSEAIITDGNADAAFKVYGSKICARDINLVDFADGIVSFRNSILHAIDGANKGLTLRSGVKSFTIKNMYLSNWAYYAWEKTPDVIEDVQLHHSFYGLYLFADITVENLLITDTTSKIHLGTADMTVNFVNPLWTLVKADVSIEYSGGVLNCKYTCDIHVVDKDGNNLEGVAVTCRDKDNNQVFSIQTGADGRIAQQTITYKKWEGTDETEIEYSPHKFTFSKNGYALLVMENVTVDARINWDIKVKFPERIRARMANLGRLAILR